MAIIPCPGTIDLEKFEVAEGSLEAKYGLPREIRFCKNCVISNQRPNSAVEFMHTAESKKRTIEIGSDGICDACRVAIQKKITIDWSDRDRELRDLCDRFRKEDGSYDCLVPGSGGKDSFYASHVLKEKYGMYPLTVTWVPHIYTEWGWKNFQAWIHAGFDNYLCTPNGRVHRLLTRLAVDKLFHPFQPFIIGQKALAPRLAAEAFNIQLIFYGENEAEYGNPHAESSRAIRDNSYFVNDRPAEEMFISGVSVRDLKDQFGLHDLDLKPYMPVDQEKVREKGIEVHYLGYYLKWHPQGCYYYSVEHGGFEPSPERTPGTYSKYNSIDDRIDDFHFYTTFIKFGIGRATYDASQEIRSGEISREEAVALVKKFDGEWPKRFCEEIFRYLSISEREFPRASKAFEQPIMDQEYFMRLADQFRSPHLWKYQGGQWGLRKTVYE